MLQALHHFHGLRPLCVSRYQHMVPMLSLLLLSQVYAMHMATPVWSQRVRFRAEAWQQMGAWELCLDASWGAEGPRGGFCRRGGSLLLAFVHCVENLQNLLGFFLLPGCNGAVLHAEGLANTWSLVMGELCSSFHTCCVLNASASSTCRPLTQSPCRLLRLTAGWKGCLRPCRQP